MQLKQLANDDDAVSPVIGVILMVAITVILAAVIATFVLGLGEQVSQTNPQASFSFQWDGTSGSEATLTITHSGGDSMKAKTLYIRGSEGTEGTANNANIGNTWAYYSSSATANSEVSAGMRATVENIGADGEIDVIWEPTGGDKSATLGDWDGPDA